MPYAPGVTDISGQIRAQGLLSGGEGLLNGLTTAFDTIKKNKEEEKENLAVIKNFEIMSKALEPLAAQVNPEFRDAIQKISIEASRTDLSPRQRAKLSAGALQTINSILNSGFEFKKMEGEQARQQQITKAQIARENALAQKAQHEMEKNKLFSEVVQNGGRLPADAPKRYSPEVIGQVFEQTAKLGSETSKTIKTLVNGVYHEQPVNVFGPQGDPVPISEGGVYSTPVPAKTTPMAAPAPAAAGPQALGSFGALAAAATSAPPQRPANIQPGSAADRAWQKQAAESTQRASSANMLKKNEDLISKSAYNLINRSLYLVEEEGAGGNVVGNLVPERISNLSAPLSELRSNYETLSAQRLIDVMNDQRKMSGGSAGTGNLNQSEVDSFKNMVTALKASNTEEVQARNLRKLAKFIEEKTGIPFKEDKGGGDKNEVKKKTGKSRFEIKEIK